MFEVGCNLFVLLVTTSDSQDGNLSHWTFAHYWQGWQLHQECHASDWMPCSLSWLQQKH